MGKIGTFLVILGVSSIVLEPFQPVFLNWIDAAGETLGWALRCGIAATGAILWFIDSGKSKDNHEQATKEKSA